eukprot:UN00748
MMMPVDIHASFNDPIESHKVSKYPWMNPYDVADLRCFFSISTGETLHNSTECLIFADFSLKNRHFPKISRILLYDAET